MFFVCHQIKIHLRVHFIFTAVYSMLHDLTHNIIYIYIYYIDVYRTYGSVIPAGSFDQRLGIQKCLQGKRCARSAMMMCHGVFTGYHWTDVVSHMRGDDCGTPQSVQNDQVWVGSSFTSTYFYSFSHSDGSGENGGLFEKEKSYYWRYAHFSRNHDYGGKGMVDFNFTVQLAKISLGQTNGSPIDDDVGPKQKLSTKFARVPFFRLHVCFFELLKTVH